MVTRHFVHNEPSHPIPRLVVDASGNIVNRILLAPGALYDPSPYTLAPTSIDGEVGGRYIDGAYTPPEKSG